MNFFSHQTTVIDKGPVDGLKTSPGPNSDIIQFSCIRKFHVRVNFFTHQTTVINC